jgi:hypothetical protein
MEGIFVRTALGVILAVTAATVTACGGATSASGSSGLTWTCGMDPYGHVTVVFTNHTSSDIEVDSFEILYYDQSGTETGNDPGIAIFTVPAGQEYIDRGYAMDAGDGTTCKAAAVDAGPPL